MSDEQVPEEFFMSDPKFHGSKGLIRLEGDEYLFYTRDNNTNHYPGLIDMLGGGKETGETPFETFAREVKEESGLEVSKVQIVYAKRYPSKVKPGMFAWFPVADLSDKSFKDVKWGDEGGEAFAATLEEFIDMKNVYPSLASRAEEYDRFRSSST